jgi:hypothetical protein
MCGAVAAPKRVARLQVAADAPVGFAGKLIWSHINEEPSPKAGRKIGGGRKQAPPLAGFFAFATVDRL